MHLRLIGICCACLLLPGLGWSDIDREVIQSLPYGAVNWSKGVLTLECTTGSDILNESSPAVEVRLRERIIQHMLQNLVHIRVDGRRSLQDLVGANGELRQKLIKIAHSAPMVFGDPFPDGQVEVGIQIQLYGGFSQMMLPGDIKQVESIKAVSKGEPGRPSSPGGDGTTAGGDAKEVYTGLVVDARGIDVQPALVPVLVDENGAEVYGAAFVSREFAVQKGLCGYAREIGEEDRFRVGPHPLSIKGLHAVPEGGSRIVISNVDAARLRGTSDHLAFLKQCRVVILLD